MRKKIMSFIMAGTMVCVTLTGCGLTNDIVAQTQQEIDEAKENLQEEAKDLTKAFLQQAKIFPRL